ncbi:acyl-protein synthetase [Niveibacterium sp. SC-1]|uniref:LuxE/PaaK family acyltransferase n=1 Tax=Niveibacterium sp. SC-1 TaxID=3135646 RepID=UPI00311F42D3
MTIALEELLLDGPFALDSVGKSRRLVPRLLDLTRHHHAACESYERIIDRLHADWSQATTREDLPYLPVGVFKHLLLASVPPEEIVRELRSSGTSGAASRIVLDRATAGLQTRALAKIVADFIGIERRPMLVVDQANLLRGATSLNARAAAVLGFSNFGRQHTYALSPDLALDTEAVSQFAERFRETPVLLFGFTFIIWQYLVLACRREGRKFEFAPGSVLIHGGGWKRMLDIQVDNAAFKTGIAETLGIHQVHNYYGMAEQVGTIFMECAHGRLHTTDYSDVVVRDPLSLAPQPDGATGLLQVLSELPRSYPGHSLLTEDVGAVTGEDDCLCGRKGRTLRVDGRLPRTELRGCSDTRVL